MKPQIIQRGAEAIIYKEGSTITKNRVKKGYRLLELDEKLRKRRTRRETKLLEKSNKLIPTPRIIRADEKTKEIQMEFVEGLKLSEHIDEIKNSELVCIEIGKNIAKLHDQGIIHGDLTTSNMILSNEKIYFIDFGLGFSNGRIEDKAVDLHLIKQALEAKHFQNFEKFFKAVLEGYKSSENFKKTIKQFEKVEKRGRYKEQY